MSKYGYTTQYADQLYGTSILDVTLRKHTLSRVFLGQDIRKSVGKRVTFRRWTGNGFYDSIKGKVYQSKYRYTVPESINNPEGEAQRQLLAAAVAYWKFNLSIQEKKEYNERAGKGYKMSGYNLFVKEVLKKDRTI